MAKVIKEEAPEREDSEAIEEILVLSVDEIKQAFAKGYYEHSIRSAKRRVAFRDPFLAYAILIADVNNKMIRIAR